jgi:hypothetical protein
MKGARHMAQGDLGQMPATSLVQDATLSFVVTGKGQRAGWLIREIRNEKRTDLFINFIYKQYYLKSL